VLTSFLLFSCVKDTDFDEAENIALTPVVELDLIYFNAEAGEFFDSITNTSILTLRDTTEIRFLDDSEIQESLKRAEFLFNFTNSIPRTFEVDFQFISEQGEETYATGTMVNPGSEATPVLTQFVQNVEENEILQLTQANRVIVSVTIPSSDATLSGVLNLQSKTTYYLEIRDRS
ncbi:MAG: hypothetical protein AAFP76_15590, partial [Bacteroidota bacterium]